MRANGKRLWRQRRLGPMPVASIGVTDVLAVLKPIWQEKPVTANRVRNRIELILDAAKALGLRSGENPAAWRGHLDKLLQSKAKTHSVKHFAALDYHAIGAFLTELRQDDGPPSRALEFAILTAARGGEVLGAHWDEIDLDKALWTIPPQRTKAKREHRIPLSDAALAVLSEMATIRMNDHVFPGQRGPLNADTFPRRMKAMGRSETAHGFRSTFRDWAGNETNTPREVCEAALGHVVGNATEAAYRRGDALERRRALMAAWAAHCNHPGGGGGVVPIRRAQ